MEITGRKVVVTGASRGIGRAFARMCAENKAHIILVVRKQDSDFEKELSNLGAASVETLLADLVHRAEVESLAEKLNSRQIDILFNNAGLLTGGLIEEQPLDDIYNMLQVNVNALIHLSRAVLPGMVSRRRGKIINNSSVSAYMHFPCASTYAASKAAVAAFTDCIRVELKNTGVDTLLLITPGIKTDMFDDISVKYGKNLEVPKDHISPTQYAAMIREAILNDVAVLSPSGLTAVGLSVAKYVPRVFEFAVTKRFQRQSK